MNNIVTPEQLSLLAADESFWISSDTDQFEFTQAVWTITGIQIAFMTRLATGLLPARTKVFRLDSTKEVDMTE